MNQFKWGIIGTGTIATSFAKDLALVRTSKHRIHSILCRTRSSGQSFLESIFVPNVFTDIDRFLDSKPDAVYIATPHTLHYEQTRKCLESYIPVLCEKPATINEGQLNNILELSARNNVFFMEGMWIRFLPSIKKIVDLVNSGRIGPLISIRATLSYKAPKEPSNRYFNPDLGGGSLLDLGIYPIFLAVLLMGYPTTIKATAIKSSEGIDEYCALMLSYEDQKMAILDSSIITELDATADILGEQGSIKILSPWNETPRAIELKANGTPKIVYPCYWEGRGFQFEASEVESCIQQGKTQCDMMPHSLSMNVIKIMDEVRQQTGIMYDKYE